LEGSALSVGVAGALVLVWAAMGVFGALTSAINHAWGVEKQPSFFKHKAVSLTMLVSAGVLLVAGLLLVSAINIASASWFAPVMARVPGLALFESLLAEWATTLLFV